MEQPLVTIIMLTYNQQPYIEDALNGILNQCVSFSYEIIIHDDYSKDNTRNILRKYQKEYPNLIKLILPNENRYSKGIDMFDCCMQQAKGKYIAWCEGEDVWLTTSKLQHQIDFLEQNVEYSLVYTDLNIFVEKKNIIIKDAIKIGYIKPPTSFKSHLYQAGFLAPLTWVFRKDCYVPNIIRDVDWSYSISLDLFAHGKVKFLAETTAFYRIFTHSVSNSSTISELVKFGEGLIKIKKKYIKRYNYLLSESEVNNIISSSYCKYLMAAIAVNDIDYLKNAETAFTNSRYHLVRYIIRFRNILLLPSIARKLYYLRGRTC